MLLLHPQVILLSISSLKWMSRDYRDNEDFTFQSWTPWLVHEQVGLHLVFPKENIVINIVYFARGVCDRCFTLWMGTLHCVLYNFIFKGCTPKNLEFSYHPSQCWGHLSPILPTYCFLVVVYLNVWKPTLSWIYEKENISISTKFENIQLSQSWSIRIWDMQKLLKFFFSLLILDDMTNDNYV